MSEDRIDELEQRIEELEEAVFEGRGTISSSEDVSVYIDNFQISSYRDSTLVLARYAERQSKEGVFTPEDIKRLATKAKLSKPAGDNFSQYITKLSDKGVVEERGQREEDNVKEWYITKDGLEEVEKLREEHNQ
jgi:Fic family protein